MKGYHYIKRGIDIILSGMAIVILSPLLLFLCIAIKLDTPGPILFKQKRVGIHRSFFQIYNGLAQIPDGIIRSLSPISAAGDYKNLGNTGQVA